MQIEKTPKHSSYLTFITEYFYLKVLFKIFPFSTTEQWFLETKKHSNFKYKEPSK